MPWIKIEETEDFKSLGIFLVLSDTEVPMHIEERKSDLETQIRKLIRLAKDYAFELGLNVQNNLDR